MVTLFSGMEYADYTYRKVETVLVQNMRGFMFSKSLIMTTPDKFCEWLSVLIMILYYRGFFLSS